MWHGSRSELSSLILQISEPVSDTHLDVYKRQNGCEKIAYDYGNQEIDQEHFLYSLLTIDESLIANLFENMGISKDDIKAEIERMLNSKPKVSGSNVQLRVSNPLNKVFNDAEEMCIRDSSCSCIYC